MPTIKQYWKQIAIGVGVVVLAILYYIFIYAPLNPKAPITQAEAVQLVTQKYGDCKTIPDFCQSMDVEIKKISGAYFVVTNYNGLHTDEGTTLVTISPIVFEKGRYQVGERIKVNR